MARSYAALHHRIWADPAWRALSADAQLLYLLLISQPQMNLAGILPLQLRKWSTCVNGWDIADVAKALDQLRDDRFVLVDEDTEEVLIRSLIRNDGAYRTPGMLVSILKFAESAQAPALRRELAVELGRLDPLNGKKADEGHALIAATRLVLMPEWTPPDGGVIHSSDGIGDGIPDGIGDTSIGTHRGYLPESATDGIGDGIGDTPGSCSGSGALLSSVGSLDGESTSPPPDGPPKCKRHAHLADEDVPPCRICGNLREAWQTARDAAAKPPPKPKWCGECDEDTRLIETSDHEVARCIRCHPTSMARAS